MNAYTQLYTFTVDNLSNC